MSMLWLRCHGYRTMLCPYEDLVKDFYAFLSAFGVSSARLAAVASKMSCVVPYVGWCWQQMLMLRIFSAAGGVRSWERVPKVYWLHGGCEVY